MHLDVDRRDLHHTRLVAEPAAPLADGEARLAVDAFALTSNNVTYAALGDMLRYWDFFPVPDAESADAHWGRVPAWGFADVVESRVADLAVGTRVYGYVPMADELVVRPGAVDATGFTDRAPHRQAMAGAYNRYRAVGADPAYDPGREGEQMVLWPLFFTAFLVDDFLGERVLGEVSRLVVSSASSKTAVGIASLAHERPGITVVGLTSSPHRDFVESLGCYDEVATYDEVGALGHGRAAFVDVAGNLDVRCAVHARFGDELAHSMILGDTHWDHHAQADAPATGPAPELFFAPTQIAQRTEEWGQAELDRRLGDAWRRFVGWTDTWLELRTVRGGEATRTVLAELVAGRADPRVGFVCSLVDGT